jgi:hypothetical protein
MTAGPTDTIEAKEPEYAGHVLSILAFTDEAAQVLVAVEIYHHGLLAVPERIDNGARLPVASGYFYPRSFACELEIKTGQAG